MVHSYSERRITSIVNYCSHVCGILYSEVLLREYVLMEYSAWRRPQTAYLNRDEMHLRWSKNFLLGRAERLLNERQMNEYLQLNEVTNKYECVLSISMFCNKLCSCARFAIAADDRFAIYYQWMAFFVSFTIVSNHFPTSSFLNDQSIQCYGPQTASSSHLKFLFKIFERIILSLKKAS